MKRIATISLSAILTLGLAQVPAEAAHTYRNCTAMHRDYPHGVAKTRRAAREEVQDGFGMAKVSRRLYRANRSLDADHDNVACEA